jgi:hypothetical protein
MSELKPSTMTDDERLKLITWLESRAQGSTMPGASRMYKLALDAIRAQPSNGPLTLKQPKMVRCKDCKYWNHKYTNVGECEKLADRDQEGGAQFDCDTDDDDFCSYGERKEGAQCTTN